MSFGYISKLNYVDMFIQVENPFFYLMLAREKYEIILSLDLSINNSSLLRNSSS